MNPEKEGSTLEEKIRVLVVEDNTTSREVVGDLLKREGVTVLNAQTARGTLKALRNRVDVVLLDYFLGKETAIDVIRKIKKSYKEKKYDKPQIVIMTGAIPVGSKEETELLGYKEVKDIVRKPFGRKELTDSIKTALGIDVPFVVQEKKSILSGIEHDNIDQILARIINPLGVYKKANEFEKLRIKAKIESNIKEGDKAMQHIIQKIIESIRGYQQFEHETITNGKMLWAYYSDNCPKTSLDELESKNKEYFKKVQFMKNFINGTAISKSNKYNNYDMINRFLNAEKKPCIIDTYAIVGKESPLVFGYTRTKLLERAFRKIALDIAIEEYKEFKGKKERSVTKYYKKKLSRIISKSDFHGITLITPTIGLVEYVDKRVIEVLSKNLGVTTIEREDERKDHTKGYIKYRIHLGGGLDLELLLGSYYERIVRSETYGERPRSRYDSSREVMKKKETVDLKSLIGYEKRPIEVINATKKYRTKVQKFFNQPNQ